MLLKLYVKVVQLQILLFNKDSKIKINKDILLIFLNHILHILENIKEILQSLKYNLENFLCRMESALNFSMVL